MGKKIGLQKYCNYTGNPVDTIIIITSVVVGTIAALAWRDYSDSIFHKYFGENEPVKARFWYAFGITIGVIIVVWILGKITETRDRTFESMVPEMKKIE